jgi:hypothetical protein
MNISNAKYLKDRRDTNVAVQCTLDGQGPCHVPIDTANSDYAEILRQVANGDITIAEAD